MDMRTERIHYSGNGESLSYLNYFFRNTVFHIPRFQYPYLNVKNSLKEFVINSVSWPKVVNSKIS